MNELNNQIYQKISELSGLLFKAKEMHVLAFGYLDHGTITDEAKEFEESLMSLLVATAYLCADGKPIDYSYAVKTPGDVYVQVKLSEYVEVKVSQEEV